MLAAKEFHQNLAAHSHSHSHPHSDYYCRPDVSSFTNLLSVARHVSKVLDFGNHWLQNCCRIVITILHDDYNLAPSSFSFGQYWFYTIKRITYCRHSIRVLFAATLRRYLHPCTKPRKSPGRDFGCKVCHKLQGLHIKADWKQSKSCFRGRNFFCLLLRA